MKNEFVSNSIGNQFVAFHAYYEIQMKIEGEKQQSSGFRSVVETFLCANIL